MYTCCLPGTTEKSSCRFFTSTASAGSRNRLKSLTAVDTPSSLPLTEVQTHQHHVTVPEQKHRGLGREMTARLRFFRHKFGCTQGTTGPRCRLEPSGPPDSPPPHPDVVTTLCRSHRQVSPGRASPWIPPPQEGHTWEPEGRPSHLCGKRLHIVWVTREQLCGPLPVATGMRTLP